MRATLLLPLLLAGCDRWTSSDQGGLTVLDEDVTAGVRGAVDAHVAVGDADRALLLTSVLDTGTTGYVAEVRDPDGNTVFKASDWWSAATSKTNAAFASSVVTLNWPVDATDAPLTAGTWRVRVQTKHGGTRVKTTVALKQDADLSQGTLVANLIYSDGLQDDASLVAAVEDAASRWRDRIYAKAGITLKVTTSDWGGPAELQSPGYGDRKLYLDAVGSKDLRVVPVLIVKQVKGATDVYGISGGIPGPLVGTDRSAVTVSAIEAAGTDLQFNDAEIELLAETFAHETGHYLGLFHPAEIPDGSSDTVTHWDSLPDTEPCASYTKCERDVGDNLMFPSPVCAAGFGTTCTALVQQTKLTADQSGVMQRYTGVE